MKKQDQVDKYIFYVCLAMAVIVGVISFLLPPTGVIDTSVLKFIALLLAFAALGVAGQNLANGKDVTFQHGETEITIEDKDNE